MSTVIKIENLWKEYRLGVIGHGTLTHDLQSWWARFRGNEDPNAKIAPMLAGQKKQVEGNHFWALRDVNLEVRQGDILGVIGKNGAGKSTLLKILSRVTAPTKGSIKVRGRIASLLEVGTGFHPELTGRENIFMNGAILGMSKQEIKLKLDEIIDFAEVESFIDTPVKRYSSGMYVRLAFAVAAHLEPEILVVDEVLAVGDMAFQRKCLGKMKEVSNEGRTILFVSHNMLAIESLCNRCVVLGGGQEVFDGVPRQAIATYSESSLVDSQVDLPQRRDRQGNQQIVIENIELFAPDGISSGKLLTIIVHYKTNDKNAKLLSAGVGVWGDHDVRIASFDTKYSKNILEFPQEGQVICHIPKLPFAKGEYFINPSLYTQAGLSDYVTHAYRFRVENADFFECGKLPDPDWGMVLVPHTWSTT